MAVMPVVWVSVHMIVGSMMRVRMHMIVELMVRVRVFMIVGPMVRIGVRMSVEGVWTYGCSGKVFTVFLLAMYVDGDVSA